jgi:hypothetical protein
VVKCRIGVNATDCTSLMPNALKSNAKLNAKLNARVRARGIKKCYSYSVKRNTTRIDRSEGKGDNLIANQQDCGDSVAINRPCVAHQKHVGGRTSAKRNPTRTILGNQAIEQEANAYINIKQ